MDENGEEAYLSLLSDWDLDAAFLTASDPYLRLKVDLKPFEDGESNFNPQYSSNHWVMWGLREMVL